MPTEADFNTSAQFAYMSIEILAGPLNMKLNINFPIISVVAVFSSLMR